MFRGKSIGGYSRRFRFSLSGFAELVTGDLLGGGGLQRGAAALPLLDRGGSARLVASFADIIAGVRLNRYAAAEHGVVGTRQRAIYARRVRATRDPRLLCGAARHTAMARDDAATRPPETTAMKLFAGSPQLDAACSGWWTVCCAGASW